MSTPSLEEQFKNLSEQIARDQNPTIQPTQTLGQPSLHRALDVFDDYEFQAQVMQLVGKKKVVKKFPTLDDLQNNEPVIRVWNDLQPGKQPVILLQRIEDDFELCKLAVRVMRDLHTKVSVRTAAELLQLAFNLKDNMGEYAFVNFDDRLVDGIKSREIEELSDYSYTAQRTTNIYFHTDVQDASSLLNTINSCCFIATSYFRLFARSAESYARISWRVMRTFIIVLLKLNTFSLHSL